MEFTVSRKDFIRELNLLRGAVEKGATTIPILSNVLIEAGDAGIDLTCTDLELAVRSRCPAKVKKAGSTTLPANRLLDYFRALPESDVQVKSGENEWVSVTCGRAKARICGMSRESFPSMPTSGDTVAELPAAKLATAILRTQFAISAEESRFTLAGALLILCGESLKLVATDGHRLAYVESAAELPASLSHRALLPKRVLPQLLKLIAEGGKDSVLSYSEDENNLFFGLGERMLSHRKLAGNFPDFERVLPSDVPHVAVFDRTELGAALSRAAQFADISRAVSLDFSPGEVLLRAFTEIGESVETITAEYSGPAIETKFNGAYLLDFLNICPEERVSFLLKDMKSGAELRPVAGEKSVGVYRYVVMPMRI